MLLIKWRGAGGGSPGERGAGGVWEAGENGAESRIPKVEGSRRNRENYTKLSNILQLKKRKEEGGSKNRAGTGSKGYGKTEV